MKVLIIGCDLLFDIGSLLLGLCGPACWSFQGQNDLFFLCEPIFHSLPQFSPLQMVLRQGLPMVTYSSDFPESFNKCVLGIFKLSSKNPDLVGVLHTCNLALWKLRQEDCEFKISTGYMARPCLKKLLWF